MKKSQLIKIIKEEIKNIMEIQTEDEKALEKFLGKPTVDPKKLGAEIRNIREQLKTIFGKMPRGPKKGTDGAGRPRRDPDSGAEIAREAVRAAIQDLQQARQVYR